MTAPPQALREALASVEGVRDVDIRSVGADRGRLTVECRVEATEGVEAAIARAIAGRWDLHRLERHEPTLENVFLRYVSGTTPGAVA